MSAQGILDRRCAWCDDPAVETVELQPATYRAIKCPDPETGKPIHAREIVRFAITADACAQHRDTLQAPPPKKKAPTYDQLRLA